MVVYSGRSLCLLYIFPCGMLCWSAVSITLVSILLPWCVFVGNSVFVNACSILIVKPFQFAFI